ncbi:MAG: DNA polymerase III subunit [Oscillospiraceae bacterium]|nr:DNA polymerase III subunit [Oscillospiraceae bacterium]
MAFDKLLGNRRIKENLEHALARGHIAHFYLISGPKGSGKHTLARLLAAGILCQGQKKPCGVCNACRKALTNTHPDLITVDDPDKKHVPIDLIRQATADMYVRPNEASHKIYLFPRGQDMGIPTQNALLKILEEPPSYGVYIILTQSSDVLLPTVRSRCTELKMSALPQDVLKNALRGQFPQATDQQIAGAIARSGGYLGQAQEILQEAEGATQNTEDFLRAYAARDAFALLKVLCPMEKWKRDALIGELEQWLLVLTDALTARSGMTAVLPLADLVASSRSRKDLMGAIDALRKTITYARGNVSPAAISGYLQWALR